MPRQPALSRRTWRFRRPRPGRNSRCIGTTHSGSRVMPRIMTGATPRDDQTASSKEKGPALGVPGLFILRDARATAARRKAKARFAKNAWGKTLNFSGSRNCAPISLYQTGHALCTERRSHPRVTLVQTERHSEMDQDRIKGAADQAKGAVKQAGRKVTGAYLKLKVEGESSTRPRGKSKAPSARRKTKSARTKTCVSCHGPAPIGAGPFSFSAIRAATGDPAPPWQPG